MSAIFFFSLSLSLLCTYHPLSNSCTQQKCYFVEACTLSLRYKKQWLVYCWLHWNVFVYCTFWHHCTTINWRNKIPLFSPQKLLFTTNSLSHSRPPRILLFTENCYTSHNHANSHTTIFTLATGHSYGHRETEAVKQVGVT